MLGEHDVLSLFVGNREVTILVKQLCTEWGAEVYAGSEVA